MCQNARFAVGHVCLVCAQASEVGGRAFCCSESCCNAVRLEEQVVSWNINASLQEVDAYSARGQFTQLDQKVGHFSGIWLNEVGRDRQAREGQGCDCRQTHVGMQGLTAVRIAVKTLLGYQEMDFREWKIQSRAWT
jgi:hypothetical protein